MVLSYELLQVAKLYGLNSKAKVDDLPYAELWMGTHPSGPSTLAATPSQTLKAFIEKYPESLGSIVHGRWGAELPYLFKVSS